MRIELTEEQEREIALDWIKKQQDVPGGYKAVVDTLLGGAHFATWPWTDAIQYAVTKCSRAYHVSVHDIIDNLDRS